MRCKASSESLEAIQSFFISNSIIHNSNEINHQHEPKSNKQKEQDSNSSLFGNFSLIGRDVWQEVIMKFINPIELMHMRRVSSEFNFWIECLDDELYWKECQMKNMRGMIKGMIIDPISEKYFLRYWKILMEKTRNNTDEKFSYRKITLDICKDLQMERRINVNYRIYLNKGLIDEKHLKIPQKDESIENVRTAIIIEGKLATTNALLFTYHDGIFPYDYIPTIFSNTDIKGLVLKSESSQAKITYSNFPMMCFESVSAHLTFYNNAVVLIFFNKLLRSSWNEVAHSIIPSLSIKPGCIYILIGLNWGALSQNSSMYNLKYTCEHYSDEFVANSEILEYIHRKKFLAYVDLKPRSEKEIFTFMDSIVKLVIMKDKGYNLFEKDFLAKVDDISR